MKHLITYLSFFILLSSCVDCEKECDDLKFGEYEISFFKSYDVNDTLVFTSKGLPNDSLVIVKIDYPDKKPIKNTCFIQRKPINSMSVYSKHLPQNVYSLSHWESDSIAKEKELLWHFSLSKSESPIKYEFNFSFKNFFFHTDSLEKCIDDVIKYEGEDVYVFHHSYPDCVNDSLDITKILWTKTQGIIGYATLNGTEFKKHKH